MDMGEILSELNREGSITVASGSPEETFALGKMLGGQSRAGTVFTLTGDLGAGKTVFAQGFAAGLGIGEPVNSRFFRSTRGAGFRSIILTYTALPMWRKWTRSAMRTVFTEKVSA